MAISFKRKGARYDASHQDRVRQKIADSQLANRLIAFFNGETELSQTQASVGIALMRKIVPDLTAQEITGDTVQFVVRAPTPAIDAASWSADTPSDAPGSPQTAKDADPVSDTKH